jgi:uncharacterized protein (DUF362 family)
MRTTRREFLISSAAGVAAVAAEAAARAADVPPGTSRVIIVTHPGALVTGYRADPGILSRMLEAGIKELTGAESDKAAWSQIAEPGQRVTMKWNELGGSRIWTHPELRQLVMEALARHAGVEKARILDYSHDEVSGEAAQTVDVPIPGRDKPGHLRRLFTDFTDVLINLPTLKTHLGKGLSVALKNHFGSITNPSDFHYWDTQEMHKSVVELNAHPAIKGKTRLIVCDALQPQWDQGPTHTPGLRWNLNALLFGFDPLAVETVGLDIIEQKRKAVGQLGARWQLPYARKMIAYGQEKGLGVGDLNRIEVERITLGS